MQQKNCMGAFAAALQFWHPVSGSLMGHFQANSLQLA
jgi:hypothetical protein